MKHTQILSCVCCCLFFFLATGVLIAQDSSTLLLTHLQLSANGQKEIGMKPCQEFYGDCQKALSSSLSQFDLIGPVKSINDLTVFEKSEIDFVVEVVFTPGLDLFNVKTKKRMRFNGKIYEVYYYKGPVILTPKAQLILRDPNSYEKLFIQDLAFESITFNVESEESCDQSHVAFGLIAHSNITGITEQIHAEYKNYAESFAQQIQEILTQELLTSIQTQINQSNN